MAPPVADRPDPVESKPLKPTELTPAQNEAFEGFEDFAATQTAMRGAPGITTADGFGIDDPSKQANTEKAEQKTEGQPGDQSIVPPNVKVEPPIWTKDPRERPPRPKTPQELEDERAGFAVLSDPTKLDPARPTVAFLDDFKGGPSVYLNGRRGSLSHGEFSARSAEANGFNALRLQHLAPPRDGLGNQDFSAALRGIDEAIEQGKLPLGAGDVINISLGNNTNNFVPGAGDPTFEEASKMLGMTITPENLREQRPAILARMRELVNDPTQPSDMKATFRRVLDTNAAIDKLQARGIDIVHAAGNDGANRFSWDFMNARYQLASVRPDGTPHNDGDLFQSAFHSLTTRANGFLPVMFERGSLLDPTPIAEQKGKFVIGDTGTRLPAEEFGVRFAPRTTNNAISLVRPDDRTSVTPLPNEFLDFSAPIYPPGSFDGQALPANARIEMVNARPVRIEKQREWAQDDAKYGRYVPGMVDVARGTSFANIGFLPTIYQDLLARKRARTAP